MTSPRKRLIHSIMAEFAPRYAGVPRILLPGRKLDRVALGQLGVPCLTPVPAPDVVIHDLERDWFFLIDAVTTPRLMDDSRRNALAAHFAPSRKGLIFFSAFANGSFYSRFADSIAWETHVWIADAPDHMIHYNGQRFVGP
jgi:hypothetical protein